MHMSANDPKRTSDLIDLRQVARWFRRKVLVFDPCIRSFFRGQMKRREVITLLGGAAATWPLVTRAQQATLPVIGFLNGASPKAYAQNISGFIQGLKEMGYIEGQNVTIEYRWAEGRYARLQEMAADLIRGQVSVIVANTPSAQWQTVTTNIPIVFLSGDDPVANGLVASLNRPGGNVTGISLISGVLGGKQLGVLHELIPSARSIAFLPIRPIQFRQNT